MATIDKSLPNTKTTEKITRPAIIAISVSTNTTAIDIFPIDKSLGR